METREAWNKSRKMSKEFGDKIRKTLIGKIEEKARNWKGNNAGYVAIHTWLKKKYGKATYCSVNKSHSGKRYEWASISRSPKRDVDDWMQLCPSCHRKYDINKLTIKQLYEIL